jgi:AmmeMemoRadiSam system protein B
MTMMRVKPAVVAGLFYPDDPGTLRSVLQALLETPADTASEPSAARPHALVAPHAGYVYSGPVAATAYHALRPWADRIHRVVVLAPSHRVGFRGIATSGADAFATPLGDIPVDRDAVAALEDTPEVNRLDAAFAEEHALEVQLPFLQMVLDDFILVPLIVGDASDAEVDAVIERLQRDDTLIVVSSDLSHYLDYAHCRARDTDTSRHIEALDGQAIGAEDACGVRPLRGLLRNARRHRWQAQTLDLRNSGDTAGDRSRVVGYGAYAFY